MGPKVMCECPQETCPYEDTRACQCISTYPCSMIDVEYTTKESENISAVLYATEKEIFAMSRVCISAYTTASFHFRIYDIVFYLLQCSVTFCSKSAKENRAFVLRFIKDNSIQIGSKMTCFYENNVHYEGQVYSCILEYRL